MKKIAFIGFAIVLFTSCNQQETRYTQQSTEIETFKDVLDAYEAQDWQRLASHYADTAKIMNNVTEEEGLSIAQMIQVHKDDASIFESWDFVDEQSTFEMIKTDDGETWVNFWGIWEGTLTSNNTRYVIPAHITAQFIDGKIVKEFGYWDISKIITDMQALEEIEDSTDKEIEG